MKFTGSFYRYGAILVFALQLGGCAYIIPDNDNAPRYNTVTGDRHVPALNQNMQGQGSQNNAQPSGITPAATTVADNPNFPPVDEATKARAEAEIAAAPLPAPTPQPATPPAPTATVQSADMALPAATISGGRHMPVENMQMSQNSYPDLATVPPRPPLAGDDSATDRLAKERSALEQDRANAAIAKDKLAHDAAAEPSLQAPESTGAVPPPAPAVAMPTPAPAPAPQSSNAPAPGVIAPPPFPVFAPPPPPMNSAGLPPATIPSTTPRAMAAVPAPAYTPAPVMSSPAPSVIYTPPAATASMAPVAPIILHPPTGEITAANIPAPTFRATPVQQPIAPQSAYVASSSGFDPMASSAAPSANTSTVYAPTGYLPDSRYER